MDKTTIGRIFGSLAVGVASSALAFLVAGILVMVRLSQVAQSSTQFDTGAFLQAANTLIPVVMAVTGLLAFALCFKPKR